jgi:hypothetical protein
VRLFFPERLKRHRDCTPLLDCGAAFDLSAPAGREVDAVHAFAAGLIGGAIAAPATMRAVNAAAPGSLLVSRDGEGLAGLLATLPLREAGREALIAGVFDGLAVDLTLLARPPERPAAVYAWGCAARTAAAARALLAATQALCERVFPDTPFFARAATEAGRTALVRRLGYAPMPGADPDMLWRPPGLRRAA